MSGASGPSIKLSRVSKRYGSLMAVKDLDLAVGQGEIVGFLGPNGAGKTTTLRLLMGFIRPTAGTCEVLGGSLATAPGLRRRVGYLPGDFRLDSAMSGRDLFRWFGRLRGGDFTDRANALCERLRLDASRRFGVLSKGNRQKVGIVQAFMHDPDVLILDEPTSGLDPLVQHEFFELVREAASRGAAILFSSHVLPEVERLASRVAIIRAGVLIKAGSVDDLLDHALHRLELRYADPLPAGIFEGVPGVAAREIDGRTAVLTLQGAAGPAMQAAASQPGLLRVSTASDDLEDLFVKLYGDGTGA